MKLNCQTTFRNVSKSKSIYEVLYNGSEYGEVIFGIRPSNLSRYSEWITGTSIELMENLFPDDVSCLEHIMKIGYGKNFKCFSCGRLIKWYRHRTRRGYTAKCCGQYTLNPLNGTMFHRTKVSLKDWFYMMLLFANSRNGVSAHLCQRLLGVSHAAAYKVCDKIRTHMAIMERPRQIGGPGQYVHIDEAQLRGVIGENPKHRAIVLGMATKTYLISFPIPDRRAATIIPIIQKYVRSGSIIVTDSHRSYRKIENLGWDHEVVNHASFFWISENGVSQSQIETYWGHLKRALRGTHIHIAHKNLWKYLQEFNFRYNRRHRSHEIFWDLISSFPPATRSIEQVEAE